ncbi:MAG: alpha-amylase family glycosyl hydrolase [Verrucomicrobiota bacterium]
MEPRSIMRRHAPWLSLLLALAVSRAAAIEVCHQPASPTLEDVIRIEIAGCAQGGVLHWGVNARGNSWEPAAPSYRPAGSKEDGVATRTPLSAPDSQGVCRVTMGPFNSTSQPVRSVDFAIQWADGRWDTANGNDYHVPITQARIGFSPAAPTLNDAVTVTVHRSAAGGQLRWGVNAEHGLWSRPSSNYWPAGTVPSEDGLAVDSSLPPPDRLGNSTIVLGPFHRAEQVVQTLHAAAHWGKVWDTDLGRNYNMGIGDESSATGAVVRFVAPFDGQAVRDSLTVTVQVFRSEAVSLWLDGQPLVSLCGRPFEWPVSVTNLEYGRHAVVARAVADGLVAMKQAEFWRVPPYREEALPPGARPGAAADEQGDVTFVLYAPAKHFVSVVGDFNGWDPLADLMSLSPGGGWWLRRRLEPGTYTYQYCLDGTQFLADPCARDVEWKDEEGKETHVPEKALAILRVGAAPFAWTDAGFRRPPLRDLVIYEFAIDDLAPGQGFTGVIARLDYIRDLGVTAVEPLPVTEFPGGWSWGYNPAFHYAPESAYGTPDELKRLVDEAHRRGLAVIVDLVLNHMDWNSPLFQLYGPDYDASPYFHLFLGENWGFPDLEQSSDAFKGYAADLLRFWIEDYHVDGFRYDATRWVGWKGYNDWGASWFAYAAKQADSNSYQIAEHLPADPELQAGTEMDSGWHDYFRWRLRDMIRNAKLDRAEFERIMSPLTLGFSNALERVAYVESHDEERFLRELRGAGFREEEALRRDLAAIAVALTAPGVAMVYAGEEFGEATPKVLGRNPLHWPDLDQPAGRALHENFRALARLRTGHPALQSGGVRFQPQPQPGIAVYERVVARAWVVVAVNFGREEQPVSVALPGEGKWDVIVSAAPALGGRGTNLVVALPAGGAAVLASRLTP